jgi:hypothetical protein
VTADGSDSTPPSRQPFEEITQRVVAELYASARRFARRGAGNLIEGRHDDAMVDVGVALEHIGKAFLARRHLLLLVGSKQGGIDLEGMRWALGLPTLGSKIGYTISASEVIRRCCALVPELSTERLRPVLDARNGVLHVGAAPESNAESVVTGVADAAEVLLPPLGYTTDNLWGNFAAAIRATSTERR